jgi:2-polyprenyl-3-methyl-5-hydroxy-6-metoxy-1,4-benzoquinol methylase
LSKEKEFPDWEELYRGQEVESMPWFHSGLDADLAAALTNLNIREGRALDLGTGPGTQAVALAGLGFKVTATDLSATAVRKADKLAGDKGVEVAFMQDDVLKSRVTGEFDFVFDRGCFHVLPPDKRPRYVRIVEGFIKPGGYLFLKCMSHLEADMEDGPYRFTPGDIQGLFSSRFRVISMEDTVFQGTLDTLPKAIFCILKKP